MTFEQAVTYMSSLEGRGWRLGLDRMQEFLRRAHLDSFAWGRKAPKFIHVAGTNGKGSTTAFAENILSEMGLRVGGYYSPYVYDVRERITFRRRKIGRGHFAQGTRFLRDIAETFDQHDLGQITEFEFKTALGFWYWQLRRAQAVALEVGMGGRLDATNVVKPACSVIVSIGLDHVDHLGATHTQIAREKAGIIKPGVPVVSGALVDSAQAVVNHFSDECGAPLFRLGKEIQVKGSCNQFSVTTPAGRIDDLAVSLYGVHMPENAALAIAAVQAAGYSPTTEQIQTALTKTQIPGRFEVRRLLGCEFVLDGAHNRESAEALVEAFRQRYPDRKAVMITGMLEGHEHTRFYEPFRPIVSRVCVAPIKFHRAVPTHQMVARIASMGFVTSEFPSVEEAVQVAAQHASDSVILVTGSFYLVGDVGNYLLTRVPSFALS